MTLKTQPEGTKQYIQTIQKFKRGFPDFKLRNNFEKMRNKKQRK